MHTQFTEESNMATALTPQTDVTSGEAYRKSNQIKTQLNIFIFYLIKSETSDSFVNHFNGHFAYLKKNLDFKGQIHSKGVKSELRQTFAQCLVLFHYIYNKAFFLKKHIVVAVSLSVNRIILLLDAGHHLLLLLFQFLACIQLTLRLIVSVTDKVHISPCLNRFDSA